jgi:hypothetical protein
MWIGFLWIDGAWHPQPSTRSSDLGTCSRRLGFMARGLGLPATHEFMTQGHPPPPDVRPVERAVPPEETRLDVEWEGL